MRNLEAAFEAVCTVQRLMHPTRGSDLAALANCASGATLALHPWTWEVLGLCGRLNHASGGLFDPCLSTASGRFADLQLLDRHSVSSRAQVHVDLGGIAKGYAVDRAVDALRAAGCSGGLVNAGGDVAAFGLQSYHIVCVDAAGEHVPVTAYRIGVKSPTSRHGKCDDRGIPKTYGWLVSGDGNVQVVDIFGHCSDHGGAMLLRLEQPNLGGFHFDGARNIGHKSAVSRGLAGRRGIASAARRYPDRR